MLKKVWRFIFMHTMSAYLCMLKFVVFQKKMNIEKDYDDDIGSYSKLIKIRKNV